MSRNTVHRALLCGAAVLAAATGFAGAAAAGDLYAPPPPPPVAPSYVQSPVNYWTGAYLGVQAGLAFGSSSTTVRGRGSRSADADGGTIGVYGGLNAMVAGNWVVGAETDLNWNGQSGTAVIGGQGYKGSSDFNGTVRARVGVSFGSIMPYATGGLAFADTTVKSQNAELSDTKLGWALGAGVEGMLTNRVTAKLEYMYIGMDSVSGTMRGRNVSSEISTNLVRAGVGYKF
jgi:outer membrane immunogenic protein